jgi:hypothetical protein
MVESLPGEFHLDTPAAGRPNYAQVVEVINRMLGALARDPRSGEAPQMEFVIRDSAEFDPDRLPGRTVATPNDAFVEAGTDLGGKVIIGLDIGGSDIKAVLAVDGALAAVRVVDWDPASAREPHEIIDPIMGIVRELRGDREYVHGVGVSFPDVCLKHKVAGGATPKTEGLRLSGDYEEKFAQITNLDEQLREHCRPDGVVVMTNDGNIAAFTPAVEYAANGSRHAVRGGLFSHAYGTDMATGYVTPDGRVPDLPLEGYKMIIDLGSWDARYGAQDVRSNKDLTRGIPGAIQKYLGQSGAYRLAMKLFARHEHGLYQQLFDMGFVQKADTGAIFVKADPDMRKPFLAHLQRLAAEGEPIAQQIFTKMGGYIGHVYHETERILETGLDTRYVFGRLVMDDTVFGLMQRGAMGVASGLNLVQANESMAHTPLMRQLGVGQYSHATVAQFGQAVGAVHFANLGMKMNMGVIG